MATNPSSSSGAIQPGGSLISGYFVGEPFAKPAPGSIVQLTGSIIGLAGPLPSPARNNKKQTWTQNNYTIPNGREGQEIKLVWISGNKDYITITLTLRDTSAVLGTSRLITINPFSTQAANPGTGTVVSIYRSNAILVYANGAWTMN